jgi:hypothetical protein
VPIVHGSCAARSGGVSVELGLGAVVGAMLRRWGVQPCCCLLQAIVPSVATRLQQALLQLIV